MLRQISVRDFAIIESVEVELAPGMTVLTGETGAGKSILIDAIGLLLGDRSDASCIRSGASQAELTALFELDDAHRARAWLLEQALGDPDSEGQSVLLRRTITPNGKSRAWINGIPATIAQLREVGSQLVDIHGQHAHHQLLHRDAQRALLDGFVAPELLTEMAARYREVEAVTRRLETLRTRVQNAGDRSDLLRFQVQELGELAPMQGEYEAICAEQSQLAHAQSVLQALQSAADWLDDDAGLESPMQRVLSSLADASRHDARLVPAHELLDGARIQLREASSLVNRLATVIELNPDRLQELDARIAEYLRLARKHRCGPEELENRLAEMTQEMTSLDSGEHQLQQLEEELRDARSRAREAADRLSRARADAATVLDREISAAMPQLGMAGGRFAVHVSRSTRDPGVLGQDEVEFNVSTNPGTDLRPLARVASGGELSRIGMALQVLVSSRQPVDTLIFDEVDTGVSGAVAEAVGARLRALGARGQVLCVTHLPQVAAQAHQHVQIMKARGATDTRTSVETLDGDRRVEALARLLGGTRITRRTLAHAQEMLSMAAGFPGPDTSPDTSPDTGPGAGPEPASQTGSEDTRKTRKSRARSQ